MRVCRGVDRVRWLAVRAVVGEERMGRRVERACLHGRDGVIRRRVELGGRLQRRQLVQTRMRQRWQLRMVVLLVMVVLAKGMGALVLPQAWIDGGRHERHEARNPSPDFPDRERKRDLGGRCQSRKVGGEVERRRTTASKGTGLINDQSRMIFMLKPGE